MIISAEEFLKQELGVTEFQRDDCNFASSAHVIEMLNKFGKLVQEEQIEICSNWMNEQAKFGRPMYDIEKSKRVIE